MFRRTNACAARRLHRRFGLPLVPARAVCAATVLIASALSVTAAEAALDPALPWYGDNRQRLERFIAEVGESNPAFSRDHRPVAIFDWDNTVIKNDIGDATMFWMLRNDKLLQPPARDWSRTSRYLTPAAQQSLNAACDVLAEPGQPLPTSTSLGCSDAILSIYFNGTVLGGAPAFAGWNYRRLEPSYAWLAHLQAGYTPGEIGSFALQAFQENERAPIGSTQTVGSFVVNGYVRIYDQIRDLITTMRDSGFDVWVVTASPQDVVERLAPRAGVRRDHVIGIRSVLGRDHRKTYDLQGCGPVADGENSMITYIDGKRCWINKVVYGDETAGALEQRPAAQRQVFGAGDSDTDITFMKDATQLKLAINRNRSELMCNAYNNAGGRWLVNPMFIAPRGKLAAGYACDSTACRAPDGTRVPCFDEDGNLIPRQEDTVFGP